MKTADRNADIKQVLSKVLSQIQEQSQQHHVVEKAWAETVGGGAASYARPTYMKEGVVWVEVDNSLHLFELKAAQEEILRTLKKRCPEVKGIKYRIR
ncbi:MAG: DUF721 domain-containing protein [Candidatus Omnitrophica bacterium]|nr:DUF721 domain-containing protein [Candidatus Omnitrophota bacterium]